MPAETIHKALEREYDRERKRRKTKKAKEKPEIVSLDALLVGVDDDSDKFAVFSDGGAGAEAVYAHLDGETPETLYERRLRWARQLIRRNLPESLEVFNLIVENRTNRKDSICAMMLDRALAGWLQNNGIGFT